MRRKRSVFTIAIACALILCSIGLFACKKEPAEEQQPMVGDYYTSMDVELPLTSATKISLGSYTFESFFEGQELIRVSEKRDDTTYYGVMKSDGTLLIPVEYSKITMEGNFIVAEGSLQNKLHHLFNLRGEELHSSDIEFKVSDIGGGNYAIAANGASAVYNDRGEDLIAGSALDNTYKYSTCGDYILAKSTDRKKSFVFNIKTSELCLRFLGSDTLEYIPVYIGGSDFLVITNETVTETDVYTVALKSGSEYRYVRQSLVTWSAESGARTGEIDSDRYVISLTDRYAIGITENARAKYSLNEGFYSLRYAIVHDKKSEGDYADCLTDRSLRVLAELPDGLSPLLVMEEGYAVSVGASGAIYVLNDRLQIIRTIDDAVYQAVNYSNGIITASKKVGNSQLMGAYDLAGNVILPFEYSYIAPFVDGHSFGAKGEDVYLLDSAGNASFLTKREYSRYWYWDGFYEKEESGHVALYSYAGMRLIAADYDGLADRMRVGDVLLVAMRIGSAVDVYRLR